MGRSDHPAAPDRATAARLMWWLVRRERRRVVAGALLSSLWMVGLALPPYVLSRAVDDGLAPGDQRALVGWSLALLGVGVATAGVAWARHRVMSRLRMETRFRVVRIVVDQVNRLGSALPRRVAAGEVATIGLTDVADISIAMTVTGPGLGAVLAYLLIGGLLSAVSVVLAVVVLVGVPVLALVVGPLLRRLQRVQSEYRQRQSRLTARLVDVIEGLRVLNAFGGKQTYAGRYRDGSAGLREQGYRVGAVSSWIDALGVGLPAVFLGAVTWLAARLAAVGTITTGDLVAVYGYAAVLTVPVYFFVEGAQQLSRALVAAGRVTRFLAQEPVLAPDGGGRGPAEPAELVDDVSGVRIRPGVLTALVSEQPADSAAVLERLGRFVDSSATWGPARLDSIALAEVRRRILLADNDADVFAGTLREVLIGATDRDGASIARAVHTAAAEDVVQGLPGGLDARVDAHGRTVSGGQRQRLRLARAVLADPEVLLAVEPTSALDAHTEALVAGRLGTARAGRTTVLTSTSPLVLDRADCVLLLVGGRVAAAGGHRELVREDPRYRAVVSRDDDG